MKALLVFVFASLLPSQAEWSAMPSVWNQMKDSNSFEGVIKTIYVDEANDRITVRVKPKDANKAAEEFMVCENGIQSARNQTSNNIVTDSKMHTIRQAFSTGTQVKLGFVSSFDKCLTTVELKEETPQQVGI